MNILDYFKLRIGQCQSFEHQSMAFELTKVQEIVAEFEKVQDKVSEQTTYDKIISDAVFSGVGFYCVKMVNGSPVIEHLPNDRVVLKCKYPSDSHTYDLTLGPFHTGYGKCTKCGE